MLPSHFFNEYKQFVQTLGAKIWRCYLKQNKEEFSKKLLFIYIVRPTWYPTKHDSKSLEQ